MKRLSNKFALRWLSLSKPPVEGLNERYTHYFWDSPFLMVLRLLPYSHPNVAGGLFVASKYSASTNSITQSFLQIMTSYVIY